MTPFNDAVLLETARRIHLALESHPMLSGLLTREHQRYLTQIIDALNEPGWLTEEGVVTASLTADQQPDYSIDSEFIGAEWFDDDVPYVRLPTHEKIRIRDRRRSGEEWVHVVEDDDDMYIRQPSWVPDSLDNDGQTEEARWYRPIMGT